MLREVLLSTIYTAFTVQSHSQRDVTVNGISMSDSGAPVCARVSTCQGERRTLNINS